MERIALFDVDKTITNRDTFALFLHFLWKGKIFGLWHMAICGISALLYLLGMMSAKRAKEISLRPLTGYTDEQLDCLAEGFWQEHSSSLFYEDAWSEIARLYEDGYRIILITASPFFYMKKLSERKEISYVMGTNLEMADNVYTGKICGENCKGEEKIKRFTDYCLAEGISPAYDLSCAYSDSLSDLPMLRLVSRRFLINSRKQVVGAENLVWK